MESWLPVAGVQPMKVPWRLQNGAEGTGHHLADDGLMRS